LAIPGLPSWQELIPWSRGKEARWKKQRREAEVR